MIDYIPASVNDSQMALSAVCACIATTEHRLGEVFTDFIPEGIQPQTKVRSSFLTCHGRLLTARDDRFKLVRQIIVHACMLASMSLLTIGIESEKRELVERRRETSRHRPVQ